MSPKESPELTELEFLDQENERARMGFSRTLAELKQSVAVSTDPRAWTRRYPLTSVVAGLAAGFVAVAAVPRKDATPATEPLVVEGRFRGVGRRPRPRRRYRSLASALSVGARWAARALLRGFVPV